MQILVTLYWKWLNFHYLTFKKLTYLKEDIRRHPLLMDRKNQLSKNGHTSKIIIQI